MAKKITSDNINLDTVKKVDIQALIDYPLWKTVAWRYARVFLATFLATISIETLVNGNQDVVMSMLKASVAAGIAAIFKLFRDESGLNSFVSKLPL